MIVPGSASPLLTTTEGGGYTIAKSLRTRASATGYLSRTPSSTGNLQKFTFSIWVKRGALGAFTYVFGSFPSGSVEFNIAFDPSDRLVVADYQSADTLNLTTTQVFRDPSAWYHIVASVDTTQATSTNRVKLYVNGSQITAFSTAIYPTQNLNTAIWNTSFASAISARGRTFATPADQYLADFNFIDAQQLTPSSFGETDSLTGVWKPKAYSGTYGTNGFYLKFTDVATTSGSNAGLGKDFSGNGNYWTTNNISVTSGATYDSMKDVPTLTDTDTANYAVLNPLTSLGTNGSISDGNLTNTGGANPAKVFTSTIAVKNGNKFYAEFKLTGGANYAQVAVVDILSLSTTSGGMRGNGQIVMECNAIETAFYINSSSKTTGSGTFATNDIVMIAFDSTTRNVWFGKNGTWLNSGDPSTASNPIGAVANSNELNFAIRAESTTMTANFGQQPFAYTPPTGYKALNTYNLPDSTIVKGNTVMDATTYAGDATSPRSITNTAGFKPDFVWVKNRSATPYHGLYDSVRGASKVLFSNDTLAEITTPGNGYVSGFNSNGFQVTAGSLSSDDTNKSGNNYVGWQWQAGQGTTSSNTSGSITSTVSVNASAGFSICTFTSQSSGTGTFGHGLGVAPSLVILKNRTDGAGYWIVYHVSTGNGGYLALQNTNAFSTSANIFNNTSPTSSVFTLGSSYAGSQSTVAYCWSEIAGFSKFSSYVGNGSADGSFIYCGFKPKFVLVKKSSASGNDWKIVDTTRSPYNVTQLVLAPNSSGAEVTASSTPPMDIVSSGFKLRSTWDDFNGSGATYIFAAFAENPFRNALAQ